MPQERSLNDFTPAGQKTPESKKAQKITKETIDGINGKSYFLVRGHWILATGLNVALQVGDVVLVAWTKDGSRPEKILRHEWRRAKFPPAPVITGGVVEELFIATNLTTNQVEVWFRNDQQVTNLELRARMDADPVYVKWGTRSHSFIVGTAAHLYYICTLSGPENKIKKAARPTATILRTENPLEANIALVNRQDSFTLTGETKYFVSTDPPDPDDPIVSEAASNPITASVFTDGQTFLTRLLIEGQTAPLRTPRALITDIQLDDALAMIWVLSVNFSGGPTPSPPIVPAPVPAVSNHPVEKSDNSGTVQGETGDDLLESTGNGILSFGSHLFVVNVTTGTVLFKTCKDKLVQHVERQVTRFQTYKNVSSPFQEDDFPAFPYTAKNGLGFQNGANDITFTDLVSDFTLATRPGITAFTVQEFDTASVPYLVDPEQWELETTTLGPFNSGSPGSVHWSFTGRRYWRANHYSFSGVYLPRRRVGSTLPLGFLLLKVQRSPQATFLTAVGSTRLHGLFLHDLESGAITTLVDFTTNFYSKASLHLEDLSVFNFSQAPETHGVFVVLGFNGTHLLWFHGQQATFGGGLLVEIKLTNVNTGDTVVVLSGGHVLDEDENEVLDEDLLAFLERDFQALRPDFFYYPSNSDESGNNFVVAWNSAGVPTLDADIDGFPIVDPALRRFGTLKKLSATLTPEVDSVLTENQQPVNVEDLTQTGPVWHVVQDRTVLGSKLMDDL